MRIPLGRTGEPNIPDGSADEPLGSANRECLTPRKEEAFGRFLGYLLDVWRFVPLSRNNGTMTVEYMEGS